MRTFVKRILGQNPWKKEWQDGLSEALHEAQQGLNVSMVVAIAVESDLYAEVLFILSFAGLLIASFAGYFLRARLQSGDLLLLPLAGFAVGASLFQFRHFYLHFLAPRAVRERVAQKAKALFFDHSQNMKGRLALLYFSEMEREVLFVTSPELLGEVPTADLQTILSKLIRNYESRRPLASLRPRLLDLGALLRLHLGLNSSSPHETTVPIYVGASDRPTNYLKIPILKGSKDIN